MNGSKIVEKTSFPNFPTPYQTKKTLRISLYRYEAFKSSKRIAFTSSTCAVAGAYLFEKIVAFVVHKYKCREVLNFNFPNGLHA